MDYECPIEGCELKTKNKPARRTHVIMTHDMAPSRADKLLAGAGASPKKVNLADLQEKPAAAMAELDPVSKAKFVYAFCNELSAEDKAIFGASIGLPMKTEKLVLEEITVPAAEESPVVIKGKTELPGYKYLEALDLSVKQ